MTWQDIVIMAAQGACLMALFPTLRDRSSWPRVSTCAITGAALASMVVAFLSLELWLATVVTGASAVIWLRMAIRPRPTDSATAPMSRRRRPFVHELRMLLAMFLLGIIVMLIGKIASKETVLKMVEFAQSFSEEM